MNFNRYHNIGNPYQGTHKRVLCVCSAGLLRSPTAAVVLAQGPFNFNTRAVGTDESHALVPLETVHLAWADEVICMDANQKRFVEKLLENVSGGDQTKVYDLTIPDQYPYRDPKLMKLISKRYIEVTEGTGEVAPPELKPKNNLTNTLG